MTQRDRDRLVVLKKAQKKLITQWQRPSNWRVSEEVRESAVRILSRQEYRRFGPRLASEYLAQNTRSESGARLCGS